MIWVKFNNYYLNNSNFSFFIYKITNLVNNKVYIGLSNNIKKRYSRHKNDLKNNKHSNSHLQNAYNKYGKENFIFEILDCFDSVHDVNEAEIEYIRIYNSNDRSFGYNIQEGGSFSPTLEETKLKMSKSLKGRKVWNNGLGGINYKYSGKIVQCMVKIKV